MVSGPASRNRSMTASQSPVLTEAAAAVSDELIDRIAICGPPEYCRDKLAEWAEAGVGGVAGGRRIPVAHTA